MLTPQQLQQIRAQAGIPPEGLVNKNGQSAEQRIAALRANLPFTSRLTTDINQRGENIVNELQNPNGQNPLVSGLKATAQGFNAISDTAGEAIRSIPGGNTILDTAQNVLGSGMGKITDVLSSLPAYQEYAAANPNKTGFEKALEGIQASGEIAGNILLANQAAKGLQKGVDLVKKIPEGIQNLKESVIGTPQDITDEAVRNTATKYGKARRILNEAEARGSKPVEVPKMYGKDALPDLNDGGQMMTQDAKDFVKGKIKELGQIKQDMLYYQDNPVTFNDYRQYVKDLIDSQRGWTDAKKYTTLQQANSILDKMEQGYKGSSIIANNQIPLQELDKIKTEQTALSGSYRNVPGGFEYDTHGLLGRAARDLVDLMSGDEANINEINNLLKSHYDYIKILDQFDGKTPNGGQLTKALNRLGGEVVGSVAGGSVGHPIVGAFAGRVLADQLNGILTNNFISNPLKRAMLRSLEYVDPPAVQQALKYLDDMAPTLQELGGQDFISTQNQNINNGTNINNTIDPNSTTGGPNMQAGFIRNPFAGSTPEDTLTWQETQWNMAKAATKPTVEQISEQAGGWAPGLKVQFDTALNHGDAATLMKLIPQAPADYVAKFAENIKDILNNGFAKQKTLPMDQSAGVLNSLGNNLNLVKSGIEDTITTG